MVVPPVPLLMKARFHDPTPSGVINQRFVQHFFELAGPCKLSDLERGDFLRVLTMVGNKLAAVWYHSTRYSVEEQRCIERERNRPIPAGAQDGAIGYSPELFFEFDAFLVQVKSCLDHVAKLPRPFVGRTWTLGTFGDSGQEVIRFARNSVPDAMKGFAEGYAHIVEEHQSWLGETIDARNRLNHMQDGGIDPADHFVVWAAKEASGATTTYVPMWSPEQTKRGFMEVVWDNLFALAEDFVGVSIAIRVPEDWRVVRGIRELADSPKSPWVPIPRKETEGMKERGELTAKEPLDRAARRGPGRRHK